MAGRRDTARADSQPGGAALAAGYACWGAQLAAGMSSNRATVTGPYMCVAAAVMYGAARRLKAVAVAVTSS